jgi:glyoxylase-like metal-dependent hydrolase (beta-lactamase superfamily II)
MDADGRHEVADRVWFRRYGYGDEKVGLIGSGDGLLVVDTRANEVHAHELIADIRQLSDEPIVAVVNTHGHWDHVFGNAAFGAVPIWGHRASSSSALSGGRRRAAGDHFGLVAI